MKGIVRIVAINMLALFLTAVFIPGFHITTTFGAFLSTGVLLTLITFIVKPILTVLSVPFTIATFGLFTLITNTIVLWILQRFVPSLIITTFAIHRISFFGLVIPKIEISSIILAYIVIAAIISGFTAAINWLIS